MISCFLFKGQNILNLKKSKLTLLFFIFIKLVPATYSQELDTVDNNNLKLFSERDSIIYSKVFQYIKENKVLLKKRYNNMFSDNDSIYFYVSEEVMDFNPLHFADSIIKYQFKNCNKNEKINIKSYLESYPRYKIKDLNYSLLKYNIQNKHDFIIFFSNISDNKLLVKVNKYDIHYPPDFDYYDGAFTDAGVEFFFFINNRNEVKKVFCDPYIQH